VARRIVTGVLLAFVGVSIVYALACGPARRAQTPAGPAAAVGPAPAGRTVIAYYFHGDVRCETCRKLEAYARSTIEAEFAEELAAGALQWRMVNVDRPENEHFIEDYGLYTRSLVLSDVAEGQETRWKNLELIWELVGDRSAYSAYVRDEVAGFLKEP
jgi:hypothetical protein